MRILVLGGTGSIGGAVVRALVEREHSVLALGRSARSREKLLEAGAVSVDGDIREPTKWIDVLQQADGVVHAANTWDEDAERVDRQLVAVLLDAMKHDNSPKAFIYTGGCWLYGATGDDVATEDSPFDPLAGDDWCIPVMNSVLGAPNVRGMVIHPGMVYERNGGVFAHIFRDARNLGYVRVIGGGNVRWPLIHRDDLADLYALMLEQGKAGDIYNAATVDGMPVGVVTRAIARRLGIRADPVACKVEDVIDDIGFWADGYALDQQMSGQKAIDLLGWQPKHLDVIADIS